ncbi:hypothetical protein Q0590_28665 [Rhodocytophaga aerolata]|uniref:DUF420 domain-containing protein n=1 Tax=Rhodocytophaga aerolata TaxID=455078 RepID=A0ABT8RDU8_9BACT|nr:hypothetical protein [Rhodocytophaga aerolata]MDO1450287.1 hypothetical protein [Rhodocytophaga aerolata]
MYPSLTSLFFLLFVILQRMGFKNADIVLSTPGLLSISLMSLSILFAFGAIASVIVLYRWRMRKIAKTIYWPMVVLSFLHLLVAAYLVYFGVIPMMSWA